MAKCPRCAGDTSVKHKASGPVPSMAKLEKWSDDGIAKATDGCKVEPDGTCPHGHMSWLLRLGYI